MPLKTLIEFGLSEKEAKVYLALLELEVAGANEISKKAGINRSSTYVVIDSLKRKGLVSMTPDSSKQKYVAAVPETFLNIVKDKIDRLTTTKRKVEEIIPEIRGIQKNNQHKPKVTIYEGKEAVLSVYYLIFNEKDGTTLRVFENPEGMLNIIPNDFITEDSKIRRERKLNMFMISPNNEHSKKVVDLYTKSKSPDKFALIPEILFSDSKKSTNFCVYGDKIEFYNLKEEFVVMIQNQGIADTLKKVFDLAWKESGRLNKAIKNKH